MQLKGQLVLAEMYGRSWLFSRELQLTKSFCIFASHVHVMLLLITCSKEYTCDGLGNCEGEEKNCGYLDDNDNCLEGFCNSEGLCDTRPVTVSDIDCNDGDPWLVWRLSGARPHFIHLLFASHFTI